MEEKKKRKRLIWFWGILVILLLLGLSKCSRNDTGDPEVEKTGMENISSEIKDDSEKEKDENEEAKESPDSEGTDKSKEESESDKKDDSSKETENDDKNDTPKKNESEKKSSSDTGKKEEPQKPSHTHSWDEIKTVINHEAEGHYETVLVKEAWTEEVPIFETVAVEICNTCGADITGNTSAHMKEHMLKGENGSRRTEYVKKQTGVEVIAHDAVYEDRWIVDKEAWTETIIAYKCSCGQTK